MIFLFLLAGKKPLVLISLSCASDANVRVPITKGETRQPSSLKERVTSLLVDGFGLGGHCCDFSGFFINDTVMATVSLS